MIFEFLIFFIERVINFKMFVLKFSYTSFSRENLSFFLFFLSFSLVLLKKERDVITAYEGYRGLCLESIPKARSQKLLMKSLKQC